jgi:iron-sulfur cluster repair protein YtfE (RIC family)
MNAFETLTVRESLRSRPLGVGILEEMAGSATWRMLDAPLKDFCRDTGIDAAALRRRLAALPENSERQAWSELPLYFLIDHLTSEHRDFRERLLPDVHRLLEGLRPEFPAGQAGIDRILEDFADFRRDFSWHMQEEEEFVFPKILRTEASLRYPDLYSEVFKGSVRMYMPVQAHGPDEAFHDLIGGLNVRLRALTADLSGSTALKRTLSALEAFEQRLRAHIYIEGRVLLPRAVAMETSLMLREG